MIKLATSVFDGISKWMSNNPTAAAALLTGGAGAIGGYALTKSNPDESMGDAVKRRLKNALVVGGLAAGAGALGSEALKSFDTAMPEVKPTPVKDALVTVGMTGGSGVAGAIASGVTAQKLFNSNFWPGVIGQKAKTLNIASKLNGKEIKDIHIARDIITNAASQSDAVTRLANAIPKVDKTTTARSIAKTLKKLNIFPVNTQSVDLKTVLKDVGKGNWRRAVIGTAAGLGGLLAAYGGYRGSQVVN